MLKVLTKPVVVVVAAILVATVTGPPMAQAAAVTVSAMTLADPLGDAQWQSSTLPGSLTATDTGGITTNTVYPLTVEPPVGGLLTTGRVELTPGGAPGEPVVAYGPSRCSSISGNLGSALTNGYVDIREVTYDDTGRLTSLAADLSLNCPDTLPSAQVRLASTVPYVSLSATNLDGTAYTNEAGTVPVTFTNDGPVPVHPGASVAVKANTYDSAPAITKDNCDGVTLDPGQTCQVSVSTASRLARVLLPVPELDARSARVGAPPMMRATVLILHYDKPTPVTATRSWPATDGVGLSWSPAGLGSYAVDRRSGSGAWQRIAERVNVSQYADTTAPANVASTYRITPVGPVGEYTDGARETAPATPLTAWLPPTGAATYASVNGTGLVGSAGITFTQDTISVGQGLSAPQGMSIITDEQGWRTGTFAVSTSGSVRAGWTGMGGEWARVTGTLTVTRAVLRADGTPAEFAAVLTGTTIAGSGNVSGSVALPVRAIVVKGTVATGLPAYIVGDPATISAPIPQGSDQTMPVALRNVGGSAGTVTTVQVVSTYVSPPQFPAWSAPATCLNVSVPPGGRCTTSLRVQYETAGKGNGYPNAAATWRGASGLVTKVELRGEWQSAYDQPTLSMSAPVLVRNAATVTLRATDPQAGEALQLHCRLDKAAFTVCTSAWPLTGLTNGKHTVTAYATDQAGHMSSWQQATITADSVGPVVAMASPTALVTLGNPLLVSWTAFDPGAGTKAVQARRRTATPTTTYSPYVVPSCCTASLSNGVFVTPTEGMEQCWSARGVDTFNQWGAWSSERCFLAPLDDRKLTSSGFVRSSSYSYKNWKSTARKTGATLKLANVRTRQVGLLVETCSTCGSMDVYVGSTRLGRVNTYASTSHTKVVLWLPRQSVERRGTLTLRSTSSKRVVVDGVLVRHR